MCNFTIKISGRPEKTLLVMTVESNHKAMQIVQGTVRNIRANSDRTLVIYSAEDAPVLSISVVMLDLVISNPRSI